MRIIIVAVLLALVIPAAAHAIAGQCIQDQYGIQYSIVIDSTHKSITGTAHDSSGGCSFADWPIIGSINYLSSTLISGKAYEITVINPAGDAGDSCVPGYMLKGNFPKGAWYYVGGFGAQRFTYVPCGTLAPVTAGVNEPGRGRLK